MLSKTIIDSDRFYDLSLSSQALYLHLNLAADDDGLIANPKRVLRSVGAGIEDYQELVYNGYLIEFESGIVAVTHWKVHNYIPNDRYRSSKLPEKQQLILKADSSYEKVCIQGVYEPVYNLDTQDRIGKERVGKDSIGEDSVGKDRLGVQGEGKPTPSHPETKNVDKSVENLMLGIHGNVQLSQKELAKLKLAYPDNWERMVDDLSAFIHSSGKTYDRHYDIITGWTGGNV
jgi:hypothetical protein